MLYASYVPANHCIVLTKITLSLTSGTKFKGGEGHLPSLPHGSYSPAGCVHGRTWLSMSEGWRGNGEL